MSKIKELISKVWNNTDSNEHIYDIYVSDIEDLMKAYAEYYAQKCLEIAAKEASANFECIGAVLGAENVSPYVEESSITGIKLPEHE